MCLLLAVMLVVGTAEITVAPLTHRALALGPCSVTVSPHDAPNGTTTGFAFTITDDNDSIAWIQVTSPSSNLAIVSANSDWLPNTSTTSSQATYFGDPIAPSNPIQVSLSATVAPFPPDSWSVQASTDSGGSNPMVCSGDTSVTVPGTTPPNISGITANALATSATIHWTTDKLTTGRVDFGPGPSYGHHVSDNSFKTSHTVKLTGLEPQTTYYYQITATDQSSNVAQSLGSTFLTAAESSSGSSGSGDGVTVTNPKDKTPPKISITSQLPKIFTHEPSVSGVATDNDQVISIEYSTDGGSNWLPVDSASGLNGPRATFTFKPLNLGDATYIFMARATDSGGNVTTTKGIQVVIDRLPPVVGGSVIALGPQVLVPDGSGEINALPGVSLSIHASSTGGATSVAIAAENVLPKAVTSSPSFTLQQAPDSGLWSGTISFTLPGTYTLVAHAIDGANNKTERTIGTVHVAQAGSVLSANGPIEGARVTVYYRDTDTDEWAVWDGLPYAQTNPQSTNSHGQFQMFLPSGTYYIHTDAAGYQGLNTASFSLSRPTPLTLVLHMTPSFGIGPVHVPWFNFGTQAITAAQSSTSGDSRAYNDLDGHALPTLTVVDTNGASQNSINWLGKPTLVTLLSTWAPSAAEQLGALNALAKNNNLNIKVVGVQENAERLRAYNAIAGSNLVWLSDPESNATTTFQTGTIPMHYFIDRKGIVRQVSYGVLTYQQLLDALTNLP